MTDDEYKAAQAQLAALRGMRPEPGEDAHTELVCLREAIREHEANAKVMREP